MASISESRYPSARSATSSPCHPTLELWKRHGIRQAGLWTVLVGDGGNQDLHYLLAWESLAERETKWNKFATDPEWLAKRAESERDGPIVASIKNMFLQPTAFSAVK